MSIHPNVVLLLILTPDDLARKTYRNILEEYKSNDSEIKIKDIEYNIGVMEGDYLEDFQISANEGDIVIFDLVTYGYGEKISWDKIETQKKDLEKWACDICKKYHCKQRIFITANYW